MSTHDVLPTADELRKLSRRSIVSYAIRCANLVAGLRPPASRLDRRDEKEEETFRGLPDVFDESLEQEMVKAETASSMANITLSFLAEASIFACIVDPFQMSLLGIAPTNCIDRSIR